MGKLTILEVLVCAVFVFSSASGVNLLLNPGFEDGIWTSESDLPDYYWHWIEGGWASWKSEDGQHGGQNFQECRTGDKCIAVGAFYQGDFGSFGQSIAVTEGASYTLGAWVNTEGWGEDRRGARIIGWRDNTQLDPWGKPISLGDTIGIIDFEGVHPEQYVYFEVTGVAPAGANQADVIFMGYSEGTLLMDDASFEYHNTATNPIPPDGEPVLPDEVTELSWTNPEPMNPEDTITCDVWFSDYYPEYGESEDDPNFTDFATKVVDNEAVNSVLLADFFEGQIELEHYYYWRVDCYDPNLVGDPELYPAIGKVWMFHTVNAAPVVEAGPKRKAWLSAGTVDVAIDATVTDDGLPPDPGTYTMLWSVDSGPGEVEFSDKTVEDPVATFTVAGEYVLKISADDGALVGEDTVKVEVYEESYSGLLAVWPLDENADDIIGGHNGTLRGDPVFDADAQVGTGSALLDGVGDYIEIEGSGDEVETTWADLTDEVTLTAWIKVNQFAKSWQAIVCKGDRSYRLQRNWNTDGLNFSFDTPTPTPEDPEASTDVIAWGELNVNDGKWHHVAGTYNGEEICLYIDGVLDESSEAIELPMLKIAANLAIGENLEYATSFDGRIDQVRLYEIGLPAEKVLEQFIDDGGSNSCGQVYRATDVNEDCYTNIEDLALMAADWLMCQDVANPLCSDE